MAVFFEFFTIPRPMTLILDIKKMLEDYEQDFCLKMRFPIPVS